MRKTILLLSCVCDFLECHHLSELTVVNHAIAMLTNIGILVEEVMSTITWMP